MSDMIMSIDEFGADDTGLGLYWRYDDPWVGEISPYLTAFTVTKRTPKGCWVERYSVKHFVLDGHGRRHSYQTKEEALQSYIIRKQRQIQHASATHDRAVELLASARELNAKMTVKAVPQ